MLGRQPSKVHELLNVAKEIFNGITPPSSAETQRIQRAMSAPSQPEHLSHLSSHLRVAIPLEELGIRLQARVADQTNLVPGAEASEGFAQGPAGPSAAGGGLGSNWSSSGSSGGRLSTSDSGATGSGSGSGLMSTGTATGTTIGSSNGSNPHAVRYMHIFEDSVISLGIFQLPMGASIPLHDHPGMTVISRVLYGSLHLRAYDWVNDKPAQMGAQGYARQSRDQVLTVSDDPSPLFPFVGNVHQFEAVTDTAVLDILSPPYAPSQNRDCTYFKELPVRESASFAAGSADAPADPATVLLEVKDPPEDFVVLNKAYEGVKVKPRRQWQ